MFGRVWRRKRPVCRVGALLLLAAGSGMAVDWEVTPRLSVGTIFTDNLNQDPPGQEESAAVLQTTPGLALRRQGARLGVNLDAGLQNLYALPQNDYSFNPQVRGAAEAELYQDRLFFNASAYVDRVVTNSNRPQGQYSLIGEGSATASAYTLNPSLRNNFGDYVESVVDYSYSQVLFGNTRGDNNADISNDSIHNFNVSLNNGTRFPLLSWAVDYSYIYQNQDYNGHSFSAQSGYPLTRTVRLLARGGYENYEATDINTENGSYVEGGGSWTPNRYLTATALAGINANELRLQLNPTLRTQLLLSRRKLDVGLDPGVHWRGELTHSTRFSTWSASYSEQVTNAQQQIAARPVFDQQNRPVTEPGQPFTLRDQNFTSKRFDASVGYTRGRSLFTLRAAHERQEYEDNINNQTIYSNGISWSRQLAPRTRSILSGDWYRIKSSNENGGDSNFWTTQIGLNHTFTPDLSGLIQYTHFYNSGGQNNGDNENTLFYNDNEYRENRLEMSLQMTF